MSHAIMQNPLFLLATCKFAAQPGAKCSGCDCKLFKAKELLRRCQMLLKLYMPAKESPRSHKQPRSIREITHLATFTTYKVCFLDHTEAGGWGGLSTSRGAKLKPLTCFSEREIDL